MSRQLTTKEFISRAKRVHKNKYAYNLVRYKSSKTPVIILCSQHGQFKQKPNYHLGGSGCTLCYKQSKHLSVKQFVQRASNVHKNFFNYSLVKRIINIQRKVRIICPYHRTFQQRITSHLRGSGCPKCSGNHKPSTQEFIQEAKAIHGNKYNYTLVQYQSRTQEVKIICKIHGEFLQTPESHLRGHNCAQCALKDRSGGFSETYFILHPSKKTMISRIYMVELTNKTEKFYKIGITTQTTKERLFSHVPYNVRVVYENVTTLYDNFLQEQKILESFKKFQYIPKIRFSGWTECLLLTNKDVNDIRNVFFRE